MFKDVVVEVRFDEILMMFNLIGKLVEGLLLDFIKDLKSDLFLGIV